MKTLLLFSPITDPTSGYHSLSYLAAYAGQAGYNNIDIIDINIKAFNYSMQKDQFDIVIKFIKEQGNKLKAKERLNNYEQNMLLYIWKTDFLTYDNLKKAQYILKNEKNFYDYMQYRWAVEIISNWLNALSILAFPGQFAKGFGLPTNFYFNLFNISDLKSYKILSKVSKPFNNYYNSILIPEIKKKDYKVIGINITYISQLPFALYLGLLIRKKIKDIKIFFGGTEVSDVWKYLKEKKMFFELFHMADACIIGEGETAFVELLNKFENHLPLTTNNNIIINPKYGDEKLDSVKIRYENISNLPLPKYEKMQNKDYLSPHSFIYYSPSRGCYWNKCTFCDYGLNLNAPTSPWRHYSVDKIIKDLKEISIQSKFIYFSVDVLTPEILLEISKKIVEEKIDIRWGAEIRLEKCWSIEKCSLLKNSGCIAISVGFESGNQRILNLINKGTNIKNVKETIKNFSDVGIAVQIMGFTGFPSETFEESMDSIQFLKENRDYWTFGGLGSFILTRGSMVAKNPTQFNINKLSNYKNEDVSWRVFYNDENIGHGGEKNENELKKLKNTLRLSDFDRPWVGGTDTPHTFFYFDKFGLDALKKINLDRYYDIYKEKKWRLNGVIKEDIKGYPVLKLFNINKLYSINYENEKTGISNTSKYILPILKSNFLNFNEKLDTKKLYIRSDGTIYPFPNEMIEFLEMFIEKSSIIDVLNTYKDNTSYDEVAKYCVQHHFLQLEDEYGEK